MMDRVHVTQNGGSNLGLDVSKNIKGLPANSWIVQIKASNKNKGEALLVANDYRRFNYTNLMRIELKTMEKLGNVSLMKMM